jgi:hypothetical protein
MQRHEFPSGYYVPAGSGELARLAEITQEPVYAATGSGIMVAHPGQSSDSVLLHWEQSQREAKAAFVPVSEHTFRPTITLIDAARDLADLARIRKQGYVALYKGFIMFALPGQPANSVERHYCKTRAECGHPYPDAV